MVTSHPVEDVVPVVGSRIEAEIVCLLSRTGPQYVSEISVALLLPPRTVLAALSALKDSDMVIPLREGVPAGRFDESCARWAIKN